MNGGHLGNVESLISERKVIETRDRFLNPCFRVTELNEPYFNIGHITGGHLDMSGGHLENAESPISERKVIETRDRFLNPYFRVKEFSEPCFDLGHMTGGHLDMSGGHLENAESLISE